MNADLNESTERTAFCDDAAIGVTRQGRNACRDLLREDRERWESEKR